MDFRQLFLRQGLLEILTNESFSALKSKVCDIVGELAGMILKPEDWPEVLPLSGSLVQVYLRFSFGIINYF